MRKKKPPPDTEPEKQQKAVLLRLPKEWHQDLRSRAFHEETTITDLVKEALREKFGYEARSLA